MDRNKNSYIFIYSIILVVVVAGALSLVAVLLQPKQAKNYEIEQKRNILSALKINVETKDVESTYAKIVTEIAVNESGNEVEKDEWLEEHFPKQMEIYHNAIQQTREQLLNQQINL